MQDVSSMLAGLAAAPEKGSLVLDVCAAPGGKSLHAADLMAGTGHVEARDLTEAKVRLIKENTERCGFRNVSARVWDALRPDPEMFGKADVVIADLPCSGLGIIGRKSDIKYKLTEEGASELAVLQRRILDVVWQYVKPGGRLVYSTCTILPGGECRKRRLVRGALSVPAGKSGSCAAGAVPDRGNKKRTAPAVPRRKGNRRIFYCQICERGGRVV